MIELMLLSDNLISQRLKQPADEIVSAAALQNRDFCAQRNRCFRQFLFLFAPAAESGGEGLGYGDTQKRRRNISAIIHLVGKCPAFPGGTAPVPYQADWVNIKKQGGSTSFLRRLRIKNMGATER